MSIRTCVGCGQRASREQLFRLVLAETGRLVVDYQTSLHGRGAWLHPDPSCLRGMVKSPGRLNRTLRADGPIDTGTLQLEEVETGPRPRKSGLEADGHPMSTQR
ncbi:YlxR family protein [Actinomycetaceae bacterium WB03_NA08]|uniref:YlxR family protein n=1 Tax=Scrofimicrobium canadense TaxID=2652290 RepID=A0A6N7W6J2_9ACTO|nr:YlxR family protein [Scrofimicrobium canadense]MSS84895.1 YlxR family protein [Scrofimicrobium canadense]